MRRKQFKGNRNTKPNFYSNRPVAAPDLPESVATPSHFPEEKRSGIQPSTTFQKIRNFDARLDRIDINIKGAAPIYGQKNDIKNYALGNEVGNFTGSLNNVYYNDDLKLLASVSRKAKLSYWGIDTSIPLEIRGITGQNKLTPLKVIKFKAYDAWLRNVSTLVTTLKQAMYTDLNIFNWKFANTRIKALSDAETKRFPVAYQRVFQDPIAQMLINYQHDIQLVTMLVFRYEYLTALLPKLTTFYRKKADMFIYIQQQLRRSLYTANIKALMMWLKQRYVDKKYISDYILPLTVLSKETDGLNSPIHYLSLVNYTPMNCIKYGDLDTPYLPIHIGTQNLTIMNETKRFQFNIWEGESDITSTQFDQGVTTVTSGGTEETYAFVSSSDNDLAWGCLKREMNAFDISTLLTTIERSNSMAQFTTAIQDWLNTAQNTISTFLTQTLDMVRSQNIIDLETAISKLASEPGGILWEQNIEFSALIAIDKFTNWTLVTDLVTFNSSKPVFYDNGYTMRIPMNAQTGISQNEMKTYSQAWYLQSDERSMSFLELEDTITFTIRGKGTIYSAKILYETVAEGATQYQMPYLKVDLDYDQVGVVSQLPFRRFQFNNDVNIYNPLIMTFIIATFENKWPEFVIEAIRSFIVPQA